MKEEEILYGYYRSTRGKDIDVDINLGYLKLVSPQKLILLTQLKRWQNLIIFYSFKIPYLKHYSMVVIHFSFPFFFLCFSLHFFFSLYIHAYLLERLPWQYFQSYCFHKMHSRSGELHLYEACQFCFFVATFNSLVYQVKINMKIIILIASNDFHLIWRFLWGC